MLSLLSNSFLYLPGRQHRSKAKVDSIAWLACIQSHLFRTLWVGSMSNSLNNHVHGVSWTEAAEIEDGSSFVAADIDTATVSVKFYMTTRTNFMYTASSSLFLAFIYCVTVTHNCFSNSVLIFKIPTRYWQYRPCKERQASFICSVLPGFQPFTPEPSNGSTSGMVMQKGLWQAYILVYTQWKCFSLSTSHICRSYSCFRRLNTVHGAECRAGRSRWRWQRRLSYLRQPVRGE